MLLLSWRLSEYDCYCIVVNSQCFSWQQEQPENQKKPPTSHQGGRLMFPTGEFFRLLRTRESHLRFGAGPFTGSLARASQRDIRPSEK